ncbi:cell division protein ZapA [Flammeovirga kamogawensis]|uniref:Cell division protein ZapA n=1 Tax=Flammeovirga kamogawensis TaxID=373891 RepID=A0ABX8H003_9BACT|nr:cell division protein ZapA [Flammeovirga kamogawensis]MBB6459265.1 cell division protein ZapA (FtsZ GTPase activity inhibitor) [Flammeovirga kamogawensis]QWG08826.1 cell division protein ZapA [Flammeovirga kamogawensis]TRX67116.1 cell division protein ZapA [Flammeovirga kamogawensis]
MGLRSSKESIQLNLCGKSYNLKATTSEAHLLRKAAERLNEILDDKRQHLNGADLKDLLVITAFDFVVNSLKDERELKESTDSVKALNKQLEEILNEN